MSIIMMMMMMKSIHDDLSSLDLGMRLEIWRKIGLSGD